MATPDEFIQIAYSMYSNPGTYALLLGSGVSRAASIPTGWEVTMDLIKKVAALRGEPNVENPEEWYRSTFGEAPNYSKIIGLLGGTQAERCCLLSQYFEPTPEDRENGRKVPSKAHKAIAELVRGGYVKVILTTNFDQLMEMALREEGITPTIIDSDDSLLGALPYVHTKCTLVKLHGDYKDTRIKNTPEELEEYSEPMQAYLDRVLDDFGLIICGWSGEWDIALRNALLGRRNRRFSTFWALRGNPAHVATDLPGRLNVISIGMLDADQFFIDLEAKVQSLESLKRRNPLTVPLAIEETKIYLSEERHRIRLHDMVQQVVEDTYGSLSKDFVITSAQTDEAAFKKRMHEYEELMKLPSSVISTISLFDKETHIQEPVRAINRLLQQPYISGNVVLLNLQLYPAYLLMYSSGIAALESGNYVYLNSILTKTVYTDYRSARPALMVLVWPHIFEHGVDKWIDIPDVKNPKTPVSEHMLKNIQELLHPLIPDDKHLEDLFDIFEYLCGLTYIDLEQEKIDKERAWGPYGRFTWKYYGWLRKENNPMKSFFDDGQKQGDSWPLLRAGFFGNSINRFNECRDAYEDFIKKVSSSSRFS